MSSSNSPQLYAGRSSETGGGTATIEVVPSTTSPAIVGSTSAAKYSAIPQDDNSGPKHRRRLTTKLAAVDPRDLKQKQNLLKLEQLALSILAIACAVGCSSRNPKMIGIFCDNDLGTFVQYQYPFRMHRTHIQACKPNCPLTRIDRTSSAAQMFVFTATLSMLFAAGALVIWFWQAANKRIDRFDKIWPKAFVLTQATLTLLWFASSVAWAVGVSEIRALTSEPYVRGLLQSQPDKFTNCRIRTDSNSGLVWSIIVGFVATAVCLMSAIDGISRFSGQNLLPTFSPSKQTHKTNDSGNQQEHHGGPVV